MSCSRAEPSRLEADAAQQQFAPLVEGEPSSALDEGFEGIACRHLDRTNRIDPERLAAWSPG